MCARFVCLRVLVLLPSLVAIASALSAFAEPTLMGVRDRPRGGFDGEAHAISTDRSVVLARSVSLAGTKVFRGSLADDMESLGQLPGNNDIGAGEGRTQTAFGLENWTVTPPEALNTDAASDERDDYSPQLTTDGMGTWIAVWSSAPVDGSVETDADILFAVSTDAGGTWTNPAALNTNAATDEGDDYSPQLTTDNMGTWIAVWSSVPPDGSIETDSDILFAVSTDAGGTWTDPAALNTNAATDEGDDGSPQLTTDNEGTWIAVWDSTDPLGGTIGDDDDILFAVSTNAGGTWTDPAALNSDAASDLGFPWKGDFYPQLSTDGAGTWIAVWEYVSGPLRSTGILFAISTDAAATWSNPVRLPTPVPENYGPQLATDRAGTWIAAWGGFDNLGGPFGIDPDLFFTVSTDDGGSWSNAAALNSDAATDQLSDSAPELTTDGAGTWIAAWVFLGTDNDVLFAVSTDDGATWTDPAALNTNATTDAGDDGSPQLATDRSGTWLSVWASNDDLGGTIETDWDILVAIPEPESNLGLLVGMAGVFALNRRRPAGRA